VFFVFEENPVYGRGRPCKNETRPVKNIDHKVVVNVTENDEAIKELQEKAGCFVLLTNTTPTHSVFNIVTCQSAALQFDV
jgi:hypothetical protein